MENPDKELWKTLKADLEGCEVIFTIILVGSILILVGSLLLLWVLLWILRFII